MHCFRGRRNQTNDNRQYSAVVRKFALTMHYHSPAAYRYLREKFDKRLPHPTTLRKWFANSNICGEPGILPDALLTLKNLGEQMKQEGKKMILSVSMDETSMKCNIQWLHEQKKFAGFATKPRADGTIPIAKNVLVFMATVLGKNVSIPIAYYCVSALNGFERAELLRCIFFELNKIGAIVMNITFDGLPANFTMCEEMGASFNQTNFMPHIINPADERKVYILLDACHMLKLIRSTLGDFGIIKHPQEGKIEWTYFERLISYREKDSFVTHRLNKHHINYTKNRMNVKLAAQLFSKSVLSTLKYLRDSGDNNFKNCTPTMSFAETIGKLFDIFNAKTINDSFKSSIHEGNSEEIFKFFDETIIYLMKLKLRKVLCIKSRRRTGFVGFIINMINARKMYEDYVVTGLLDSLSLFYNSQDLLESFFSRIRALLGANDNPTAQEFKAAIRKLLFFNEISSSIFANCEDNLDILTVSSEKPRMMNIFQDQNNDGENNFSAENEIIDENIDFFEEIEEFNARSNTSEAESEIQNKEEATIAYVAGTIEKKIKSSKFACKECLSICEYLFDENEKISGKFIENNRTQRPCKSTFNICKYVHKIFERNLNFARFDYEKVYGFISDTIAQQIFFENTDYSHDENHRGHLIAYIVDEYLRAYATYKAQCLTLEQHKMLIRNSNRKNTHFMGQ